MDRAAKIAVGLCHHFPLGNDDGVNRKLTATTHHASTNHTKKKRCLVIDGLPVKLTRQELASLASEGKIMEVPPPVTTDPARVRFAPKSQLLLACTLQQCPHQRHANAQQHPNPSPALNECTRKLDTPGSTPVKIGKYRKYENRKYKIQNTKIRNTKYWMWLCISFSTGKKQTCLIISLQTFID